MVQLFLEIRECRGKTLKYLTVEPDGYEPSRSYPMLILLHGFGASMADLTRLCPVIDSEEYVYICPNGPLTVRIGYDTIGYAWTPLGDRTMSEDVNLVGRALATLIDEVMEKYRVVAGQAILGGFSQGGMIAYHHGLPNSDVFRGLLILSSKISDTHAVRARLPSRRTQQIFIAHGTADTMISIEDAREAHRLLESEGYEPEYREYSMGHEITQDVLDDLVPWVGQVLPHAES